MRAAFRRSIPRSRARCASCLRAAATSSSATSSSMFGSAGTTTAHQQQHGRGISFHQQSSAAEDAEDDADGVRKTPSMKLFDMEPWGSHTYAHFKETCLANGLRPVRPLGHGTFGRVYLVREVATNDLFALKVQNVSKSELTIEQRDEAREQHAKLLEEIEALPEGIVRDHMLASVEELPTKIDAASPIRGEFRYFAGQLMRHSEAEREVLRYLDHPLIAKQHQSFDDEDRIFMLHRYLPGGTLSERLRRSGGNLAHDIDAARHYAAELTLALAYLKSRNVAHRDIKPDNVLLDEDGHLVINDFGLATYMTGPKRIFCGTAEYLPPELLLQKKWDAASLDWWALGVVVYEMLTGTTPFAGPTSRDVFTSILTANVRFPDTVPEDARSLISGLLLKDPPEARLTSPEIFEHEFFASIDWEAMAEKKVPPPFKPSPGFSTSHDAVRRALLLPE